MKMLLRSSLDTTPGDSNGMGDGVFMRCWRLARFLLGPIQRFSATRCMIPPRDVKDALFENHNGFYKVCAKKLPRDLAAYFDGEHMIPVNYGDSTSMGNLQLLCVQYHRVTSPSKSGILHALLICQPMLVFSEQGSVLINRHERGAQQPLPVTFVGQYN